MKEKWILFAGVVLLTAGILIKKTTNQNLVGLLVIITGVSFKAYYIISKIRAGIYKPGYEAGLLLIGLIMFFTGIYFRHHGSTFNPVVLLMIPGISLKVLFIVFFIIKTKARKAEITKLKKG